MTKRAVRHSMNLAHLLISTAIQWPDHPAVVVGTKLHSTYADLAERTARFAASLKKQYGLKPGDRIALAMKNSAEFCECMFGAWHGGFSIVPMNAKLHPKEFGYILENSGAKLCFVSPSLVPEISEIAGDIKTLKSVITIGGAAYSKLFAEKPAKMVEVAGDDLAWIFYTSGTTGFPKGAMLSHRNLMSMTLSYFADVDQVSERDCLIHAAPMSHGSGLYILPHVAKGAAQIIPESGGFSPEEVFDLLNHHTGGCFFFAPTMVKRLISAPGISDARIDNIKTIVYGGGPMYAQDAMSAIEVLGFKLVQIYGQGEAPMTITALSRAMHADIHHPDYLARLASVGVAQTVCRVKVVDEKGHECGAGEVGEIIVSGDVVMSGYWKNPKASAAALRDGWLYTGDMGAFDGNGYLTLKDRSKDVIISGGSNIYPREIEEILLRHDQVLEVSVVGLSHDDWGEEVVAYVVVRDGAHVEAEALDQLCLDNIARFKRPKSYRFIDRLPKNNYGKVLKTKLRELSE